MAGRRPFRSWVGTTLGLVASISLVATGAAARDATSSNPDRDGDTVKVSGSALSALAGRSIGTFGLFRYNDQTAQFEPIPFQVDQRFLKTFDPGLPTQFSEMVYDVFGEDNGLFDTEDEIAFLVGDAGARAPLDGSWVEGADETRFEIAVTDPRPVNPDPPRWAYLYTGSGLPTSTTDYVAWSGSASSSISTEAFRLDFDGNWVMPGITIFGPCGGGTDLIDRFKGRAEPGVGAPRQDEEDWSGNSTYLGGLAGPIRAIRYVRGARSGVNTILRDIVEPNFWSRNINLRVHPVDSVWVYFDWLPQGGSTLFTSSHPTGLSIDGVPDAGVSTTFTPWHLMRTAEGGMFVSWNVPQTPLFASREFYYVDDASYDDIVPTKSSYPDDDDSAYGAHGVKILGALDSNVTPIQIGFRAHPLCAGEGDANLALTLQEMTTLPGLPAVVPQAGCGAIRTVRATREGPNVRLDWQPETGVTTYRVYTSVSASLDRSAWTFAGETGAPTYVDPGGATGPDRFYSVVCTVGGADGPW